MPAICPGCKNVRIKWDWCHDVFCLFTLKEEFGKVAFEQEIVMSDKTLTTYSCVCGCVIGIDVTTSDSDMYLLFHEALNGIDWELDENSHRRAK